jgi:hypothetical protein
VLFRTPTRIELATTLRYRQTGIKNNTQICVSEHEQ